MVDPQQVTEWTMQLARENYYGNPFWQDPTDPGQDPATSAGGLTFATATQKRKSRERIFGYIALVLFVGAIAVIAYAVVDEWRAGWVKQVPATMYSPATTKSEVPNLLGGIAVVLVTFFVVTGVIAVFMNPWVQFPMRRTRGIAAQIATQSWNRYGQYVAWVAQNDSALYGQIVNWHQQQDLIDSQNQMISLQRQTLAQQVQLINEQARTTSAIQDAANQSARRAQFMRERYF